MDIFGKGFGFTKGRVLFDTVEAPIISDQWGDTYIKCRIPVDTIAKTITIENSGKQKSAPFITDYTTLEEKVTKATAFDIYIAGEAIFTITDCGNVSAETRKIYPGVSSIGGTCDITVPLSFSCSYSGQNKETHSASMKINPRKTPGAMTISGNCQKTISYGIFGKDGSENRDVYKIEFEKIPLYDTTSCNFGVFGPQSVNFITLIDLKEYRWNVLCNQQTVKSSSTITFSQSGYQGDGISISISK